ncbi:hypothetical protein A2995_01725 [Candidatus Nomurabacteria bacterium RIFCSPLOWO2_01_FULL_33_24]|uniref:Thioredoxin domain-containing protein n=1 Tax=Candidatus Nomurabacteria bacterium RIFCSPLOWO2_01_FULL_33_24 TaxID=1801765 RepID=A0A1F6X1Q3_9BACT|nr:MAG: hypothetical protein A2995_01725 [Candidatus Nomurabacteria bacterium RIFCSPLOWO2_01_FULL_33_24]
MNKQTIITIVIIVVVVLAILIFAYLDSQKPREPAKYDEFAQCLGNQGAIFNGAFWCSACATQKEMFGKSVDFLPYQECSNQDKSMKQECQDKGIVRYPTWEFSDGEKVEGVIPLENLAEKTGCLLPE